jgi:hypothetical protein
MSKPSALLVGREGIMLLSNIINFY